jgi:pyruvate,water dikinase
MNNWIYWLEELGHGANDLVGKKCANLGEMTCMGLRVPPGFALSLKACTDFMTLSGAMDEIKDYLDKAERDLDGVEALNEVSAHLRSVVDSKEMPEEMKNAVLSCYRRLCERCNTPDVAVSTRSAGAKSHPGQYETHLNVKGESDVLDFIKKVWSSAFNPRSLAARKRLGLPLHSDPIGVAVLRMVDARAAGVLFTADPNTGDHSKMIIEANWGLGESVVGGEAVPDMFILRKDNLEILDKKLGGKGRIVKCCDRGIVEEQTPCDQKETFCLTDEEIVEIARLGKVLEKRFGVPQDTEWAVEHGRAHPESVVLLQTRPEVIAKKADPLDQVINMMVGRFSC